MKKIKIKIASAELRNAKEITALQTGCNVGKSHPENRNLKPFICRTICWLHSAGGSYAKSPENCRVAKHRNQIKPDALKMTNAAKCDWKADMHQWLRGKLISGAFKVTSTFV